MSQEVDTYPAVLPATPAPQQKHDTHPSSSLSASAPVGAPPHHQGGEPRHHLHFVDAARAVISNLRAQREAESSAHQKLRQFIPHSDGPEELAAAVPGFVNLSQTGVIYVTERASKVGFSPTNPEWANFGQGAPETGALPGCPERKHTVTIQGDDYEYAPVTGLLDLRKAVANLYNDLYRKNKASKYTAANVCIVPGGRAGLTRIAAAIGDVNVGFFLPEYTAYEEMLYVFKRAIPIPTNRERVTRSVERLKDEITERGIRVVVSSNPCNPTGGLVRGEELSSWLQMARETQTTLVLDEFYSHYIYTDPPAGSDVSMVSSAEYVDDVEKDPVVILDGLTKNWRCPGWRVCWVVGPSVLIGTLRSAGSFLEGGANHPLQTAAIPLLDPMSVRRDAKILQDHFRMKRDLVVDRLRALGARIETPESTFYVWANLEDLPHPLDNGLSFFEEALKYKVVLVPGIFFDVNPGKRRELFHSPYHHYVRISFGPTLEQLKRGLDALERMVAAFKEKAAIQQQQQQQQQQPQTANTTAPTSVKH
eukprot:TRINITY_DN2961_c0_g1_i3.p1 TRINITY_DN2961_c0_g1~~TRINITY_DN2961_c0_g1_i3.p1  ORF type:complete len:543 (-),score=118.90 TRINITY_DN2961_c0_g1_i3:59-1666(-)